MRFERTGSAFFFPLRELLSTFGVCMVQMAGDVVKQARDQGLIVITAGKGDVVRLVPPLIITDDDVDLAVSILAGVINNL